MKCTTSKRSCQGYGLDLGSTAFVRSKAALMLVQTPTHLPHTTSQERYCLDFFHSKTSKELPGSFPSGFWDNLVFSSTYSNEALLHLSMALGSLHQKACEEEMAIPSQDIANKRLHFALLQCNKSVYLLRKLMNTAATRQDREICLIACVLLICFEVLRGHYGTAMLHLGNGRKVLTEYLFGTADCRDTLVLTGSPGRNTVENNLIQVFARLDIQGANFGTISPQFKLSTSELHDAIDIPRFFADLQEARIHLDVLTNNIERFLTIDPDSRLSPTPETIKTRNSLLHQLTLWSLALSRLTPHSSQTFHLLALHQLHLHLRLTTALDSRNTEIIYDTHHATFSLLLSTATACLAHSIPSITLDIGVIQPLYYTAIRCRDPQLRRHALSLLWRIPHREGMWDTTIMSMVAARVIQLEEAESVELPVVPEWARFQAVYILLNGEGDEGGTLYCSQRKDRSCGKPGLDHPGIPEDMVWYQHDLVFDGGMIVRELLGID